MVTSAEKEPLINVYIEKNKLAEVPYQLQPVIQKNEGRIRDQNYNISIPASDSKDSDYSQ
jgi:hypothetical protein